jgi:hypothetical protein
MVMHPLVLVAAAVLAINMTNASTASNVMMGNKSG